MSKKDLIEEIVKIVLTSLRKEKGRLTKISNTCRINRGKLTDESMAKLRFYHLILLFYAIYLNMTANEFETMIKDIYYTFVEKSAEYDYTLFNNEEENDNQEWWTYHNDLTTTKTDYQMSKQSVRIFKDMPLIHELLTKAVEAYNPF